MSRKLIKGLGLWSFLIGLGLVITLSPFAGATFAQLPARGSYASKLTPNVSGDLDPTFGAGGKVTTDLPAPTGGDAYAAAQQTDGKIVLAGAANFDFDLIRVDGNGNLDPTFGRGGKITTSFTMNDDRANAVALQADGKIVAAGYATIGGSNGIDFAVARYNPDGTLDGSFDGDGKVTTDLGAGDRANAVAIQSDGKIVVAGWTNQGNDDFAVARYNPDGTLDSSFDGDGKLVIGFPGNSQDRANGLAIQGDGKIVAAGQTGNNFGVMRLNTNGALDSSFSGTGQVTTNFSGTSLAHAVVIQPDGKLVVAGEVGDFALARYNTNGSLDTSFSGDGILTTDFGLGLDIAFAVGLQPDGKIVAAGRADRADDGCQCVTADFGVARYLADGMPDTSFDGDGRATTYYAPDSLEIARALVLQPGGKVLEVGYAQILSPANAPALLVRYNSDGSLDSAFGTGGKLVIYPDVNGANQINAIEVQQDGKIVAAGELTPIGYTYISLARYNSDGSLDSSFANTGYLRENFGAIIASAQAMVIQPDGKIVVAGFIHFENLSYDFLVARYNADGTLDTGFGTGGRAVADFDFNFDRGRAVALQSDGKIVVAGDTQSGGKFAVARFNANGTLDTGFGTNGEVTTNITGGEDIARAVAVQSDGKVVVAGVADNSGSSDFVLARYLTNGTLDNTFSGDGIVLTDFPGQDRANAVLIQSDGLIIASGYTNGNFALARYLPNGTLDSGFGNAGLVTTSFGSLSEVNALAIQSDGKLLAVGYTNASNVSDFALARYNSTGTLDTGFGLMGKVTTDFVGAEDHANAVAIQSSLRVVVGGYAYNGTDEDFALARYLLTDAAVETSTPTSTHVQTSTATVISTASNTPVAPSATSILTSTPTQTPGGSTATTGPTSTRTSTATRTITVIPTNTLLPSGTPSQETATQSATVVSTGTASATPTSVSITDTVTATATATGLAATPTACLLNFDDVPEGSTFYTYIRCLACRGIISGYADSMFRPGNQITRGQIAKMVSNAAGFEEDPGPQIYEDVPSDSTFYMWINRLSNRGYIGGYPCGTLDGEPCNLPDDLPYFRPFANSTRGQLAKIVSNAGGVIGGPRGQYYADVSEDNPFYLWVMRLTLIGVMSGYPCGGVGEPCDDQNRPYFRPFANVTRGQASKIVANTFFPECQTPQR